MKITEGQLRRIIRQEVKRLHEMPARRGSMPARRGSTLPGFNTVWLEGDEDFAPFTWEMTLAKKLGKPVTAIKAVSTEDGSDYYDMYIDQIENEKTLRIPGFPGQAATGTLRGMPVVLTNDMGAGFIYM